MQREERRREWRDWYWHCPELGTAVSAVGAAAAVPVVVSASSSAAAAAACGGWEAAVASLARMTEAPCTAQSSVLGIGW